MNGEEGQTTMPSLFSPSPCLFKLPLFSNVIVNVTKKVEITLREGASNRGVIELE